MLVIEPSGRPEEQLTALTAPLIISGVACHSAANNCVEVILPASNGTTTQTNQGLSLSVDDSTFGEIVR